MDSERDLLKNSNENKSQDIKLKEDFLIEFINENRASEEEVAKCNEKEINISILKIFAEIINYLGILMRIIFQIGEFYTCIIFLNMFFELIIIFLGSSTISDKFFFRLTQLFFSLSLSYLLLFPISLIFYELFQFNWITQLNPFCNIFKLFHFLKFQSECIKCNDFFEKYCFHFKLNEKCKEYITSIIIILLLLIYILFSNLDKLLFKIIQINIVKYFLIFVLYFFHSILLIKKIYISDLLHSIKKFCFEKCNMERFIEQCSKECSSECKTNNCSSEWFYVFNKDDDIPKDPFIFSIMYSFYIDKSEMDEKKNLEQYNKYEVNKKNSFFMTYFISTFPDYFFRYATKKTFNKIFFLQNKPIDSKYSLAIIVKIHLFFFIICVQIIAHLIIKEANPRKFLFVIYLLIFILVFPIQLISFNFHCIYRLCKKGKGIDIYNIISKYFSGFKIINKVLFFLFFLLPLVLSICNFIFSSDKNGFTDIDKDFNYTGLFNKNIIFNDLKSKNMTLKSAMCHTKLYNMNLIKFASLAQIMYYDNIDKIKFYLKNSVYNGYDNIIISDIKFLNKKNAMLMMIDIDINNNKAIRVFAIRGTKTLKDFILDVEMFSSSALFSIIRLFPLVGNLESYFSKKISEYLSLPIKIFKEFTLTNQYVNELSEKYIQYANTTRNIIFTGHSLGGGLAKLLGIKYNKQSISFSGPGVTPLETIYSNYDDKYMKSYFIDIIPDNDFIPRVEVSSGTSYRVICEELFPLACHKIDRTLCMMGIMCDEEKYTGNLCDGIFDSNKLNKMRKIVHGDK